MSTPLDIAKNETLSALKNDFTVDQYVFKNKTSAERNSLITTIDRKWCQFQAVCDSLLTADDIRNFQSSMDFAVIISVRKYVLGYALATEVSLNATTKSLLINSLCARSLSIKTQLINICHNIADAYSCESLHLHALLPDVNFYKAEGFKRSEVQFACDETHNNDADAEKFKRAIKELQQQMENTGVISKIDKKLAKVETPQKLERVKNDLYKLFYSEQTLTNRIVLRGIIESGIVDKNEVMTWTTKKLCKTKLGKIARTFTSTVPMTKCLVGGNGGGAGPRCLDDLNRQGSMATKRGRSDDDEPSRKKGKGKQKASDPYGGGSAGGGVVGDDHGQHARTKGKGKQKENPANDRGNDPYGGGSAGGGVIDLTFSDNEDGNESHSGETTETDDDIRIRNGESQDLYRRFYADDTDTEIDEDCQMG